MIIYESDGLSFGLCLNNDTCMAVCMYLSLPISRAFDEFIGGFGFVPLKNPSTALVILQKYLYLCAINGVMVQKLLHMMVYT